MPAHRKPRVLVAEDDREMRRLLVGTLARDGLEVLEAADGGALLERLASERIDLDPEAIDLVVADVWMPVCNGLEILRTLREADWNVPFVLMTAFGDEEMRAAAESLAACLFAKPFALDDLRTAVALLLGDRFPGRAVGSKRPVGSK